MENLKTQSLLLQQTRSQQSRISKDIDSRRNEHNINSKVLEALKFLLDKVNTDIISEIDELVTLSLRSVFERDLFFHIDVSYPPRGPNYEFIIKDKETGYEGEIMSSVGGSIAQTAGILLRFIYLLKYKKAPFFLSLDEAFGAISPDYLPRLIEVLKKLCEKFGFDMLVITHQLVIKEAADQLINLEQHSGVTKRVSA